MTRHLHPRSSARESNRPCAGSLGKAVAAEEMAKEEEMVEGGGPDASQRRVTELLATERAQLSHRIAALQRDVDEIIERSNDAARDDEHDPEGATIAFERAQALALLDAAHRHLADVEVAEFRLAAGQHGRCEGCGGAIPDERRLARPTARTCVACAS